MRFGSRQKGVSLIEVMVAVLIFSIGLVGLAALLIMATKSNQAAYLRTQVTFLASGMADRMRANPAGVWLGNYNFSVGATAVSTQDCSGGCTPTQIAAHDKQVWSSQLNIFLPNPSATIACNQTNAGYTPTNTQINMRPPYGGTCTMKITWSEQGVGGNGMVSGESKNHLESNNQTFAWEFQP